MMKRRTSCLVVAGLAAIVGSTLRPASMAAAAKWGAGYFPNVELATHNGDVVHFYDLIKGKIVAIDLIYTTCQYACPLETARLAQVQKILGDRVGRDVLFLSITIDPDHDTPPVLKAYAEKYHVGPGWLFLTGKQADIDLLSKKLGLYTEPDPNNKDGHTPTLLVGNEATGQWIRGSALDNPRFTATMLGDWMNSWRTTSTSAKSYADVKPLRTPGRGEFLFARRCSVCHTIGKGEKIGPDLAGVSSARDRRWLARYIAMPEKLLKDGDPIAVALFSKYQVRMPNLSLTEDEGAAIIDYVDEVAATTPGAADRSKPEPKSE